MNIVIIRMHHLNVLSGWQKQRHVTNRMDNRTFSHTNFSEVETKENHILPMCDTSLNDISSTKALIRTYENSVEDAP